MRDLNLIPHHPVITELVDVLCSKTQNTDRSFFQAMAAFFLGKVAGTMRAKLITKDRGEIPINIYSMALGSSGFGKGHSINIMEELIFSGFKKRFMEDTFVTIAEGHINKLGIERAARNGTSEDEEIGKIQREFDTAGTYAYTFDSGTPAAIKQMIQKLRIAQIGAINYQVDEIGLNLASSLEVLTTFLELYDKGNIKQKLTKNTAENKRGIEIDGSTPTNALIFGTPSKLFDGGQTEDLFYSLLDTGYARRCIFGYGIQKRSDAVLTPAQLYQELISPKNTSAIGKWRNHFQMLADPAKYDMAISVPDAVAIELIAYRMNCEKRAEQFSDHEEIQKAEMIHRYFKVLKLAGAFAFVDEEINLTMDHLEAAVKLVEEAGQAFYQIMNREKAYVKLARFLAGCKIGQTHADLNEALPFYKSGQAARNEMMTMATAWGYKNNVMIRKEFIDGIEFFVGETLKETDTDKLMLSISDDLAYNYKTSTVKFSQLERLAKLDDKHWASHSFKNQNRKEELAIPGFNMIVLDIDGKGTKLDSVHKLLKDYKFMTYTTKRHTMDDHRFRLIIPMNFHLELSAEEYKEFMQNILDWLPFETDEQTIQRSRKWLTNKDAICYTNTEGDLLDILRFVPRTSKNEAYKHATKELASLDNLERWFAQRIASGNRNNQMLKFAMLLVDAGQSLTEVEEKVLDFNQKLSNKLSEDELRKTVFKSVAAKYVKP